MPLQDLAGKTAVITGGASGIGLALAEQFGAEGANIVIADVQADALEAARQRLEAAGVTVLALTCDVRSAAQIESVAAAAQQRFGNIHLVCNNAGVVSTGRVAEITQASWEWVIDVDLWGVIHGCRVFLPILSGQGEPAHIINTASMAGLNSGPYMAPYYVAKYGVVALSESIFYELAAENSPVGVSVLCPGFVQTGIARPARNAPPGIDDWVAEGSEAGAGFAALLRAGVEAGKEPAEIASLVRDAVRENRFYILPHGAEASWETVERRAQAIVDGQSPPPLRWNPQTTSES